MNKTELVESIEKKSDLSKKDAEAALNAFFNVVEEQLKAGDKVQLQGFGTFEVKNRPARTGVNPATKQPIEIPAAKVPSFKPGTILKDKVNMG